MPITYFPDDTPASWAEIVLPYSPVFQATGLTFTGTGSNYPTHGSYYVKSGKIVTFWAQVDLSTVTNFGTGQYKIALPVMPLQNALFHFTGWVWKDYTMPADEEGNIVINADHLANDQVLDLHFLVSATANPKPVVEKQLTQSNLDLAHQMTVNSRIYVNGTYIASLT